MMAYSKSRKFGSREWSINQYKYSLFKLEHLVLKSRYTKMKNPFNSEEDELYIGADLEMEDYICTPFKFTSYE